MRILDQHGRLSFIILFGLFIIMLIVIAMAFIIGDRTVSVVDEGPSVAREAENMVNQVEIPENWQTYTNEENQYTFDFPSSWGTVVQKEPSQDTFVYTFTSQERVTVTQTPDLNDAIEFSQDYSVFNFFTVQKEAVEFCSESECLKPHDVPTDDVRIFVNEYGHDGAEHFYQSGLELYMLGLVNNDHENYPGVNVIALVEEEVDLNLEFKERVRQSTVQFDYFNDLRDFFDYIR